MIRGIHGLFFSSRPNLTLAFLCDKLGLPGLDIGDGWLVFDVPVAEVGAHPVEKAPRHKAGMHDVSFICDDLRGTVVDLRSRGVRFDDEIQEQSYTFTIHFTMPGGIRAQLLEPKDHMRFDREREPSTSAYGARDPRARSASTHAAPGQGVRTASAAGPPRP